MFKKRSAGVGIGAHLLIWVFWIGGGKVRAHVLGTFLVNFLLLLVKYVVGALGYFRLWRLRQSPREYSDAVVVTCLTLAALSANFLSEDRTDCSVGRA